MPAEAKCPACKSPFTAPVFRRGVGNVNVRCKHCSALLAIHRPSREQSKTDIAEEFAEILAVPGYQILGVLGKGGMGLVFSAVRLQDQQLVALKVLPPECAQYPELVERFDKEAQMMATLSHPGIVPVLDRGRVGEHYFLVADYVTGCTLKDRISKASPIGIDEVIAVATPVSEAIQCCHDAGIVHRDLKPANVLLSMDGRVLVTDFGIANLIERLGDQTDNGVMIGTPQYVAPEQLRDGSSVTVRADQYSLAVMIYEMLTGALPMGVFEPPSRSCQELTVQAESTLLKALSRDPANRYPSMRQFMRAFRRELKRPAEAPQPEDLIKVAAAASSPTDMEPDRIGSSTEIRVRVLKEAMEAERRAADNAQDDLEDEPSGPIEFKPMEIHEASGVRVLKPPSDSNSGMVERTRGRTYTPSPTPVLLPRGSNRDTLEKGNVTLIAIILGVGLLALLIVTVFVILK